jgi:hypothetical protein
MSSIDFSTLHGYNTPMDHTLLCSLLDRLSLPDLAVRVARGQTESAALMLAELGLAKHDRSAAAEAALHFAVRALVAWRHGDESADDAGLAMGLLDEAEELWAHRAGAVA